MQTIKNVVNWFEIPANDLDRAQKFYQGMLAQDLKRVEFNGTRMAMFPAEEPAVSGALIADGKRKPAIDGSLLFLNVEGQLDACLKRVPGAGGSILVPRTDIAPHGFIAIVRDSEGNSVGLHSMT
jgi:predicted enzyme related to lactoylglutathione lyase